MVAALEGIRVLDLTRLLPGGLCTQILADFGAEVIKVEEPELGDWGRNIRPFAPGTQESYRFLMLHRNKKSITLNLKNDKGREALYRLAKTADVVLEGFRPGVVKRLGVDYETIRTLNPRIVYCSLTGFGQDGPYVDWAGHDVNYLSIAGVIGLAGNPGGPPIIPGVQIADIGCGGMQAALGILIALMARERTGRGQYIDSAMLDGAIAWLHTVAGEYFAAGKVVQWGNFFLGGHYPCYSIYECKDGKYISLASLEPWFWVNLCKYFGHEDFIDHQYDDARREEMFAFFRAAFKAKTRDEWVEELKDKDVCIAPVNTVAETSRDPQVLHRKMLVETEHPRAGKFRQIGIPLKLSETPGEIRLPAPAHGEHTQEILSQMGYSEQEIVTLRQEKVIR